MERMARTAPSKIDKGEHTLVYMYASVPSASTSASPQQFAFKEYVSDPSDKQKMMPQTSRAMLPVQKLILELSCAEATGVNGNVHLREYLPPPRKPSNPSASK
jgi:hypothetical protein